MQPPAVQRIALVAFMASLCTAIAQMRSIGSHDLAPAAPAGVPPVATSSSQESIENLRRELGALRALVSSRLEEPGPEPTVEIQPAPRHEPEADQAEDQEADELQDLEERFSRDGIDSRWALESIDHIERSIADVDLDGVYLTGVDCRSSLCRMELEVDRDVPTDQATRQLVDGLGWQGGGRLRLDDGRAVLYLERGAEP